MIIVTNDSSTTTVLFLNGSDDLKASHEGEKIYYEINILRLL